MIFLFLLLSEPSFDLFFLLFLFLEPMVNSGVCVAENRVLGVDDNRCLDAGINATNTGFVETAKAKIILGVDLVNF